MKVGLLYVPSLTGLCADVYSSQASVFVRDWALERWTEGSLVSLQTELPVLKQLIREQQALEEHMLAAQEQENGSDGAVFEER